jgi:elongation factor 1 alpha-like protein
MIRFRDYYTRRGFICILNDVHLNPRCDNSVRFLMSFLQFKSSTVFFLFIIFLLKQYYNPLQFSLHGCCVPDSLLVPLSVSKMSRHRNFRGRNFSFDDDYYDEDSGSEAPWSPSMAQFMYNRDDGNTMDDFFQLDGGVHDSVDTAAGDTAVKSTSTQSTGSPPKTSSPLRPKATLQKATQESSSTSIPKSVQGGVFVLKSKPPDLSNDNKLQGGRTKRATRSTTQKQAATPQKQSKPLVKKPLSAAKQKLRDESLIHVQEGKSVLSMVVIGHVDAGKSTLMGHLLHQLGFVDKRTMHKFEKLSADMGKASFKYAWVLDNDDVERERGVTMDVGFNQFETENRKITLLDAPGHKDFIPNMISGATQADVAMLVVTAPEDEFNDGFCDGGQTKEHATLVRNLGVKDLLVAVNKMDQIKWDKTSFLKCQETLNLFLKGELRFKTVRYIPVSGLSGENLVTRKEKLLTDWYSDGLTLAEGIDQFPVGARVGALKKPFRLSVTDVYKSSTLCNAVVVAGRVQTGACVIGDKLLLQPTHLDCTVKNLSCNNTYVNAVVAGQNVEISLAGIDDILSQLKVGQMLCAQECPVPVTNEVEIKIQTFAALKTPIIKGTQLSCHHQCVEVDAVVSKLVASESAAGGTTNKTRSGSSNKAKRPRRIAKKEIGVVRIKFPHKICIEKYDNNKQLGRLVLRQNGVTVASGMVLGTKRKKKRT